ncbi:response regulator transcription factor [Kutzneria chonburiensis]|uniref:Response regulator n=1 Tax=Kutzneria chonburiensis TaxID=1483604 RepID=A0ABV6MQT1_9PSEU|nr:response regulator transcription factor [Kutzneria chonburiensis]
MRIVLAEDSGLLRESLVSLLSHFGHDVLAAVGTAAELITVVRRDRPDVVVTDVRMPPGFTNEGLRAAIQLRGDHPTLPVLVLSQHTDTESLTELLATGGAGVGYLLKDRVANGERFVAAVREVAGGGTVIDQDIVRRLIAHRRDPLGELSNREMDVLRLMAEGHSNAGIGQALVISEVTVSKHIGAVFAKLGLHADDAGHRRVLAVLAYLRGQTR